VLEDNCQSWLDVAIDEEFSYKAHLELKFQMICLDGVIFKEWCLETIVGFLSTRTPLALLPSHIRVVEAKNVKVTTLPSDTSAQGEFQHQRLPRKYLPNQQFCASTCEREQGYQLHHWCIE
jgi:hypothetical protein